MLLLCLCFFAYCFLILLPFSTPTTNRPALPNQSEITGPGAVFAIFLCPQFFKYVLPFRVNYPLLKLMHGFLEDISLISSIFHIGIIIPFRGEGGLKYVFYPLPTLTEHFRKIDRVLSKKKVSGHFNFKKHKE